LGCRTVAGRDREIAGFTTWDDYSLHKSGREVREQEKSFLLNLVSKAPPSHSQALLEVLHPWDFSNPDFDTPATSDAKRALESELTAAIAPRVAEQGIELMQQPDGIRRLCEKGKFVALKYCLLHPDSPLWKSSLWQKLVQEIRKGQNDVIAFRNSRDLMELIVEGLQHKLDIPISSGHTTIASNQDFIGELWKTVITRQIQFRLQIRFIRWRQILVRAGVPEAVLPLTEELRARLAMEQKTPGAPIRVD